MTDCRLPACSLPSWCTASRGLVVHCMAGHGSKDVRRRQVHCEVAHLRCQTQAVNLGREFTWRGRELSRCEAPGAGPGGAWQ